MNKLSKEFYCNLCEKKYKSYQSLWNHNKKKHKKSVNLSQKEHFESQKEHFESQKEHFECRYCDKSYKHYQSKNRHEKNCNKNIEKVLNEKCEKLEKENEELKLNFQKQMTEMKEQIKQLLNTNCKIHPKTLQKINC